MDFNKLANMAPYKFTVTSLFAAGLFKLKGNKGSGGVTY